MTNILGAGVSVEGILDQDVFTFNAAADIQTMYVTNYGLPGVLYGEVATLGPVGLAVTYDTTADTQVRLAHDGEFIVGVIEQVENRVQEGICVCAVRIRGGLKLPVATGHTVNVGDMVGGCTAYPGNIQTITPLTGTTGQLAKSNFVTSIATYSTDGCAIVLLR
jgi:hypothetical protein